MGVELELKLCSYVMTGLKELLKISHDHKFPSKCWTSFCRLFLQHNSVTVLFFRRPRYPGTLLKNVHGKATLDLSPLCVVYRSGWDNEITVHTLLSP